VRDPIERRIGYYSNTLGIQCLLGNDAVDHIE
jgi:hypothetical protein